ncbi:hypothetical protein ASC64_03145 [Nocardioides sp. Root122]|uniref:hypothetical protein n=1 Tax=Nocardioides TaxID=1839 RepID=UPI000703460F|nr:MULTISPECIES: hypothetical protein [Nocardioides]KQV77825.1 hypothetical protein ASC64_03145 [Nocardioides sp. Root122]MCK9822307.1 hypothetical protein [Nocardioides cavernae]
MSDLQRIFVITEQAGGAELAALRARLGRSVVVLTAPTAEARRVVEGLGAGPGGHETVPEVLLAPVRFPGVDRGHRLDDLVRRHAVADRWRDIVVVADPATVTLLLRVLAPDQLPTAGPVTEVGLPRGTRPVPLARALVGGAALALVAGLLGAVVPVWVLPLLVVVAGLALLVVPGNRHHGQTLLIAAGVAVLLGALAVAGSSRFPGAW